MNQLLESVEEFLSIPPGTLKWGIWLLGEKLRSDAYRMEGVDEIPDFFEGHALSSQPYRRR